MEVELIVGAQVFNVEWERFDDSAHLHCLPHKINLFHVGEAVVCRVKAIPPANGETYMVGYSYRSHADKYDGPKGRRLSFTQAIEHIAKEKRTLIWQAYNAHFPPERERRNHRDERKQKVRQAIEKLTFPPGGNQVHEDLITKEEAVHGN